MFFIDYFRERRRRKLARAQADTTYVGMVGTVHNTDNDSEPFYNSAYFGAGVAGLADESYDCDGGCAGCSCGDSTTAPDVVDIAPVADVDPAVDYNTSYDTANTAEWSTDSSSASSDGDFDSDSQ